jgi:hypothetical protein
MGDELPYLLDSGSLSVSLCGTVYLFTDFSTTGILPPSTSSRDSFAYVFDGKR